MMSEIDNAKLSYEHSRNLAERTLRIADKDLTVYLAALEREIERLKSNPRRGLDHE